MKILSIILLSFASALHAADPTIGFEIGMNFHTPKDGRFSGAGQSFFFVLGGMRHLDIGYQHEVGTYTGQDNNVNHTLDYQVDQIRILAKAVETEHFGLDILLGGGYADHRGIINGNNIRRANIMADIGASSTILRHKGNTAQAEIRVETIYRYSDFDSIVLGGATQDLENLTGFTFGLHFRLDF